MEVRVLVEGVDGMFQATAFDDVGTVATGRGSTAKIAVDRVKTRAIIALEDPDLCFNVVYMGGEEV